MNRHYENLKLICKSAIDEESVYLTITEDEDDSRAYLIRIQEEVSYVDLDVPFKDLKETLDLVGTFEINVYDQANKQLHVKYKDWESTNE